MTDKATNVEEYISLPQGLMDLRGFAVDKDIPERVKVIFALKSFGLNQCAIGRQLGIAESTVRDYMNRYDPEGRIADVNLARKMFLAGMFETLAVEAISTIPRADVLALSPMDKVSFASKCMKVVKEMHIVPPPPQETGAQSALQALKKKGKQRKNKSKTQNSPTKG